MILNASEPIPNYKSAEEREIGEKLNLARIQKAELIASGADLSRINAKILDLKRKLRDGANLKAGDFLGNDRFRLMDFVGDGGFASVWKGYDFLRDEMIALKILHGQYSRGILHKQRFFRGAKQMAKLRHPHIVSVIEPEAEDGGYYYFSMELVEGTNLHRRVLANGQLSINEVLKIISKIGRGLEYAHSKKIIHRDVKPSNILIGDDGSIKLTDFDLVKAEGTTGGTRTGAMGTFIFAAPEMMIQAKSAQKQADVYGLAMLGIFALYGKDLPASVFRDPGVIINTLAVPKTLKGSVCQGNSLGGLRSLPNGNGALRCNNEYIGGLGNRNTGHWTNTAIEKS